MAKLRSDSWDAQLTEADAWRAYLRTRSMPWNDATEWIAEEFGIEAPSKSAYYRFAERMRSEDFATRMKRAAISVKEAGEMADRVGIDDADLIGAFKSLAADAVMNSGDAETASRYVAMAASIADRTRAVEELKLKKAAQLTKDEQLRLAREKFEAAEARLNAVKAAVTEGNLSAEERQQKILSIFGM